jgi:hypothetical protein
VDRLDPYRPGPGGAGPQLYQMGRSAGVGRGGRRIAAARLPDGDDAAAGTRLHLPRRRAAGKPDPRPAAAAERRAVPPAGCRRARPGGRCAGGRVARAPPNGR